MNMIDLFGDGEFYILTEKIISVYVRKSNNSDFFGKTHTFAVVVEYKIGYSYTGIACGYKNIEDAKNSAARIAKECG